MEVIHKVSYWYDKKRCEYRFKKTRHQIVFFKTEEELLAAIKHHEKEVTDVSEPRKRGKSPE